ncbi:MULTISPECIES: VWA domain-containing protein [unclassified Coleofasciculus]|uniref:VWA domain-containing protein n=1 Tax=unclassified Coleofasciculus TaxID=2692782 RepID=UPI0018830621|nr:MULTISPECIES: VWA domain-containing protein [unclassified Coleofasciculus]MBE9129927.1 VWA domain-containing protein [Coleofasciculus sp. LEGE 07081]MBE9151460.1 VWA domain-containing protein [Coleofasciculus sp. LEGE 07092]
MLRCNAIAKAIKILVSKLLAEFKAKPKFTQPRQQKFPEKKRVRPQTPITRPLDSRMPSKKLFHRDVFILIDQSGSMVRRDAELNNTIRWKALPEVIEGHVYRLLNETSIDGDKICSEIVLTFFSPNRPCDKTIYIEDTSQVPSIFDENQPDSSTFITPTLEQVINQWFSTREDQRGGFIIIYTDGQFDDRDKFLNLIQTTCTRLKSQDELKIVIVGFGSEINPKFYLELDKNVRGFTDAKGLSCNIVVFDLLNQMPNIIELLNRQLENPDAGLPLWAKERYPELFA